MDKFFWQLGKFRKWQLFLMAILIWGYVLTRWIHGNRFLAGVWGIKNDEIAVVTIKQRGDDIKNSSVGEITITDPGISIWDGLNVLGVPLVLFILGAWFQKSQQKQATDEAREEVLQTYFDRISALLVDQNLMAIAAMEKPETSVILINRVLPGFTAEKVRTANQQEQLDTSLDIIRARTLSILRRFEYDIERKSSIMRFLAEAEIVSKLKLNLSEANLRGADLQELDLQGADLRKANLEEATLRGVNLRGANLEKAHLTWADLEGGNFEKAKLQETDFSYANLKEVKFKGANLEYAGLGGANLSQSNCLKANLEKVNLQEANLEGANLERTSLEGAILRGISFNGETIWPDKTEVAKARKVSSKLRRKLGLPSDSSFLEESI